MNKPLYQTKKEPRYLIRLLGLDFLALVMLHVLVMRWLGRPIESEPTPWFVFVIIFVVLLIARRVNHRYRHSYIHVYADKVKLNAIELDNPLTFAYADIQDLQLEKGIYIDTPGPDIDMSNKLQIVTTAGETHTFKISCTRASFQDVSQHLLQHRKKSKK